MEQPAEILAPALDRASHLAFARQVCAEQIFAGSHSRLLSHSGLLPAATLRASPESLHEDAKLDPRFADAVIHLGLALFFLCVEP